MAAAESFDVESVADLRAIVGEPLPRVITKETPELDERAIAFIGVAPFLVIATSAADGSSDASPKGGPPGFVKVVGPQRLLIPEFPGNRRLDGVQNLVERPGIGLLFIVPGITETLRVNGTARLTRDPELGADCAVDGRAAVVRDRRRGATGLQPLQQGVSPFRPLGAGRVARPGRRHEPQPLDRRARGQRRTTRARDPPRGRRELPRPSSTESEPASCPRVQGEVEPVSHEVDADEQDHEQRRPARSTPTSPG